MASPMLRAVLALLVLATMVAIWIWHRRRSRPPSPEWDLVDEEHLEAKADELDSEIEEVAAAEEGRDQRRDP
jgi:hypothetical protein